MVDANRGADSVYTPLAACGYCGAALAHRPRGRGGRFCSARCRAAWHNGRRKRLLDELAAALDRAGDLLRQLRGE